MRGMRIEQEYGHWMVTGADIEGMKEKFNGDQRTHTMVIGAH